MSILVMGASGELGTQIMLTLSKEYEDVYGTYHQEQAEYRGDVHMIPYKLGDQERLKGILEQCRPAVIISCLAGDYALQMKAHRQMAEYLAAQEEKRMVYLSSANVFDGDIATAHTEADAPKAESEYGKFKLECEEMLTELLGEDCVILRLPMVFGRNSARIDELIGHINRGDTITTYENLYMNFATTAQLNAWLSYILKHDLRGIFHVGTEDVCEYNEFLERVIASLGLGVPIYATEYFPQKCYRAVLPGRSEIPEELRLKVEQVFRLIRGLEA